jgi:hypothetical protein
VDMPLQDRHRSMASYMPPLCLRQEARADGDTAMRIERVKGAGPA